MLVGMEVTVKKRLLVALALSFSLLAVACGDKEPAKDKKNDGRSGVQKAIDRLYESYEKGDADLFYSLTPYIEEPTAEDIKYIKDIPDSLEDEYGKNLKISVADIVDYDEYPEKEINVLQEDIKEKYNQDVKIDKAVEIDAIIRYKGNEDDDKHDITLSFFYVENKDKWYLLPNEDIYIPYNSTGLNSNLDLSDFY
jgi:hypothetical protein